MLGVENIGGAPTPGSMPNVPPCTVFWKRPPCMRNGNGEAAGVAGMLGGDGAEVVASGGAGGFQF
jgi:hypothetical protein